MAIIKVRLEAVRYLAAKAKYEENETCKKIMKLVTGTDMKEDYIKVLNCS